MILQFNSDFNGAYYYQDNSSKTASYKSRPYYITCVGPEDALRELFNYAEAKFHSKGFKNFLFLTSRKSYDVHPSIVMNTMYYTYEPDRPMVITGAQKGGKDNHFRIKLKADFSELPASEAYLTNPGNYEVTAGYEVETINAIKADGKGFTHEVILTSAAMPKPGIVTLALNTKLPDWVNTTNLDADMGMSPEDLAGKTFGIRYLINGIYDAYYPRQSKPQYFSFPITVKD